MEIPIALKLFLSFLLGGAIGLEREINEKKKTPGEKPQAILGIRSYSLMAAAGCIAGLIYPANPFFSGLFSIVMMTILIIFYCIDAVRTKEYGITTEMALVFSFVIGAILALELLPLDIIFGVTTLLVLLLSRKESIKQMTTKIKKPELNSFINYAVIALLILPFLPNVTYSLSDIPVLNNIVRQEDILSIEFFNPFKLWLIVTLITGIDILGYILERSLGQKKGWILASIAGGFISSTATTQSIALESKNKKTVDHLVSAAIISNIASFFQIALILAAVNSVFLINALPFLITLVISAGIPFLYFVRKKSKTPRNDIRIKEHSLFSLKPALKFAGIFLAVTILTKISLHIFGSGGLLVTSAIGALAGIDAVMINTAELAGKSISYELGVLILIVVNAVNLLAKSFYSFAQGKREFAVKFTIGMVITILGSLLSYLLIILF